MRQIAISIAAALLASAPTQAAETITYSYDAKGRLVKAERSGSAHPSTGSGSVKTEFEHDKANNRRRVKTTGSPNPPPP